MPEYKCSICGLDFDNQAEAEHCRKRGITMFSRRVGERVQFTEIRRTVPSGRWVHEKKEGTIKRIDFVAPQRYPGHTYGIAAIIYLVEEDSGKKSRQSFLVGDQMRTVSAEKFITEALKMDPKLASKLKKFRKIIS